MLISCTAYQRGRKLDELGIERIGEYLGRQDVFVWVAFKDATQEDLMQLKDQLDFHELAIEDAVTGRQRPKIEEYGDDLFAVLRLLDEHKGELKITQASIFAGADYVVSVRSDSAKDFSEVRKRCEHEPQMMAKGPGYVFYALIDAVVDRYFPLIEKLEMESEKLEDHIFTKGAARSNIYRLYRLKRKVMTLRHAVEPMMEAVGKMQSGRVPSLCANLRPYFRDVSDHLSRIVASIDSIRDTISTAIQVNLSMVAIDQGEGGKKLAAFAGIFAVATVLAGVWGMNFEHMPELHWKYGYLLAIGTIATACGILYWRFKKTRWL